MKWRGCFSLLSHFSLLIWTTIDINKSKLFSNKTFPASLSGLFLRCQLDIKDSVYLVDRADFISKDNNYLPMTWGRSMIQNFNELFPRPMISIQSLKYPGLDQLSPGQVSRVTICQICPSDDRELEIFTYSNNISTLLFSSTTTHQLSPLKDIFYWDYDELLTDLGKNWLRLISGLSEAVARLDLRLGSNNQNIKSQPQPGQKLPPFEEELKND